VAAGGDRVSIQTRMHAEGYIIIPCEIGPFDVFDMVLHTTRPLKDSIFIPIETSGDGEVNIKSRVQMKLFEARAKAQHDRPTINEHRLDA
jgi:hypothetical protein